MDIVKNQLILDLKTNKKYNHFDTSIAWRQAFKAYNENNKDSLKFPTSCSTCFKKVKAWLEKN